MLIVPSFLPLGFCFKPIMFITTIISYNPILYSNVAVFGPLTSHCSTHSAFEAFVFHSFHLLNSLDLPSTSFCHWFIVSLSILSFQLTFSLRRTASLSVCLVWRWKKLILIELILRELSLVKSELNWIDLCLDMFK
jgi:hypothetical protein